MNYIYLKFIYLYCRNLPAMKLLKKRRTLPIAAHVNMRNTKMFTNMN